MRPLLALLTLVAFASCRRAEPVAVTDRGPALPVRTASVTATSLPVVIEAPATVRPAERATIAAKLAGTVATFPLGLGQAVNAGDILLTLNAPEAEARVRQAQAQLAESSRSPMPCFASR